MNSVTIGRDVLGPLGKTALDIALRGTQAQGLINLQPGGYAPTSLSPSNHSSARLSQLSSIPGDVCILIDGTKSARMPLWVFHADEVERVEVYAANSDYSRTIGYHMNGVPGCEPVMGFNHPPYFVVWLRGTN